MAAFRGRELEEGSGPIFPRDKEEGREAHVTLMRSEEGRKGERCAQVSAGISVEERNWRMVEGSAAASGCILEVTMT